MVALYITMWRNYNKIISTEKFSQYLIFRRRNFLVLFLKSKRIIIKKKKIFKLFEKKKKFFVNEK